MLLFQVRFTFWSTLGCASCSLRCALPLDCATEGCNFSEVVSILTIPPIPTIHMYSCHWHSWIYALSPWMVGTQDQWVNGDSVRRSIRSILALLWSACRESISAWRRWAPRSSVAIGRTWQKTAQNSHWNGAKCLWVAILRSRATVKSPEITMKSHKIPIQSSLDPIKSHEVTMKFPWKSPVPGGTPSFALGWWTSRFTRCPTGPRLHCVPWRLDIACWWMWKNLQVW